MKTIDLVKVTQDYLLWTIELDEKTKLIRLDEMPDDAEISIFHPGTGVEYLSHDKPEKVIYAGGLFKKNTAILRVKKQTLIYKICIDLPSKKLISVKIKRYVSCRRRHLITTNFKI